MNRNLPPVLLVLAVSALVGGARAAQAQRPEGPSPVTAGAHIQVPPVTQEPGASSRSLLPQVTPLEVDRAPATRGPVLLGSTPVTRSMVALAPATAPTAPIPIDWRMPSSNVLIAGGVAAAIIGLYVVKEEAGGALAVAGAGAAVYGLYLRYR